jgi:hypothetical protein
MKKDPTVITFGDILDAAQHNNLDDSVRELQDKMGQTDGGVAAQYFCGVNSHEEHWAHYTHWQKQKILFDYLATEFAFWQAYGD